MSDPTTPKRNEAVAPVAWVTHHDEAEFGCTDGASTFLFSKKGRYDIPLYSQQTIDALQGEVSRLRADAIRYHYLRDRAHPDSDEGFAVMRDEMSDWGEWYAVHVTGDALDAAIDALNLEPPTDGR